MILTLKNSVRLLKLLLSPSAHVPVKSSFSKKKKKKTLLGQHNQKHRPQYLIRFLILQNSEVMSDHPGLLLARLLSVNLARFLLTPGVAS